MRCFRQIHKGYQRFAERHGLEIMLIVCVAVITGTAVWAKQPQQTLSDAPQKEYIAAVRPMQESLSEAAAPSPTPGPTALPFVSPVQEMAVLQGHAEDVMTRSGITGVWRIHDGIDLRCSVGEEIRAMADGTVIAAGKDDLRGAWCIIDHGSGFEAEYTGLTSVTVKSGEKVRRSRMIGTGGAGLADEADLPPHLHLRITLNGMPVDPAQYIFPGAR